MASDHQMAITRTARSLPPAQISKSTRQIVPAFLQKLYEMVNDPKNSDLIRWSDTGDSFFVLDHERFAHDVLGRWFKHRNFNSFVRQLNMYGFHKIPHLQQGVLKSDNDTEYWNFAHPNFHRGQPDLLCLIQRKKTANQSALDTATLEVRDSGSPNATGGSGVSATATSAQGQVIDIQAIISGIAAIKRHQTTISAELNELKQSNQLLWQDAMAARAKHQKQQDTINRIVKFLAGVFGQHATHVKDESTPSNSPHVVIPRRQARFMIEDAKREGKNIVEMDDIDVTSPMTVLSETSPAPTELSLPADTTPKPVEHTPTPAPTEAITQIPQQQTVTSVDSRSVTPTRAIQGVINQLTPAQLSQLLNSLASQPVPDPSNASANFADPASSVSSTTNHLMQYNPQSFDLTSFGTSPTNNVFASSLSMPTPGEGLIAFNPYDSLTATQTLERNWKAAEDINKEVDAVNNNIHNLIQTFGLDPSIVEPADNTSAAHTETSGLDASSSALPLDINGAPVPSAQEFDFDNFFNMMPVGDGSVMDYGDLGSSAFLDDPPSPDGSIASPVTSLRHLSPEVSTGVGTGVAGARKRKSDVSDLEMALGPKGSVAAGGDPMSPTGKSKKRKEG